MFGFIFKKIFGSKNDRYLRRLRPIVARINALEPQMQELADEDFAQRMAEYRQQVQAGERTLDDLLPEVFALVREASRRVMGMRHYDVQLVGGIVLHRGKIAEMKTGEGKTLVATLPVALNALSGKGVHVVTVNDYLATRDAQWMGKLYNFLGLSVGVIVNGLDDQARKEAYGADITYGTNNEFGFDYLRDNMKFYATQLVQRGHNFAIVDEVDSILIDEARTPLIISGASDESVGMYRAMDQIVRQLGPEDYTVDEKARTAMLSEEGVAHCEALLHVDNLFDPANITQQHCILQALKAPHVIKRSEDNIVQHDKVVIVDEFTGRLMDGRRYSDGLHQALEAKENVTIAAENQTLASITFQNYFRMYDKLAGMTGTADTEAVEFHQIYNLEVVSIPPNKPMQRKDYPDLIYRTRKEKYDAIIEAIRELYEKGQPVLVGTISIETSEMLSQRLKKLNIPHSVLNAKQHAREAEIVAQAGQKGHVTIATNMAGRGTDIVLGEGVLELGGLHILGTERHESRRIDNQLRGRSGRQGDPGRSKFFLSLEDDLMRIFGSERMSVMLQRLGLPEGEALIHPWISKALEKAQQKVEERNFDIRKNLLKYDNVMNDQRKVIYEQRKELMAADDVSETIREMRQEYLADTVSACLPHGSAPNEWQKEELKQELYRITGFMLPITNWANEPEIDADKMQEKILDEVENRIAEKNANVPENIVRMVEKNVLMQVLDQLWKEHIASLDLMRHTIVLRAYGQKDPLNEYKKEAFNMFSVMLDNLREKVTFLICRTVIQTDALDALMIQENRAQNMQEIHETPESLVGRPSAPNNYESDEKNEPFQYSRAEFDPKDPRTWGKVARNDLCPCGSGKKYKHCHGKI